MKLIEMFPEISLNPASAKDIKQWILQLAVEGKLTKKWREDNPKNNASLLLKNIDLERLELVKAKKIKNEVFENVNSEEFNEIPKNWFWKRLGQIGFIFNGDSINATVKEQKYTNIKDGFPYISTKDVGYGFEPIDLENGVKIPKSESKFKVARRNTVVICAEGGSAGKKMGILTEDSCFGNKLFAIHEFGGILSKYILIYFGSSFFQDEFQSRMSGIIGGISRNKFAEIHICLPPLEEQHAIVSIVESLFKEVDELATQAKQLIELKRSYASVALKQLCEADTAAEWQQILSVFPEIFNDKATIKTLRETILQLAVQGKLSAKWRLSSLEGGLKEGDQKNIMGGEISSLEGFAAAKKEGDPRNHQTAHELLTQIKAEKAQLIKEKKIKAEKPLPPIEADEIPFELPEGWVWTYVLDISLKITDGEHATPQRTESGYKLISARNVTNEGIKLEKVDYVDESEFLRIRKRCDPQKGDILISCSGSVGRICLVDKDDEYCMVRSVALVKQHHNLTNGKYLVYALRSLFVQHQIIEKSRSTAQSNLFLGKIKEIIFPFPPLQEQQIIVEKVNALMGLCDELESLISKKEKFNLINILFTKDI